MSFFHFFFSLLSENKVFLFSDHQIFSIPAIWIQTRDIVGHFVGVFFFNIEDFLPLKKYFFKQPSRYNSKFTLSLIFFYVFKVTEISPNFHSQYSTMKKVVKLWEFTLNILILSPVYFAINPILFVNIVRFFYYCYFSFAKYDTWQLSWRTCKFYLLARIIKLYVIKALIEACCWVKRKLNFGLHTSIYSISSANHKQACNWGVVTDLLCINRAPINKPLVSLS